MFLVFKVEARACYLCLLIGRSSQREDLVEARACYLCLLIGRSSRREDLVRASSILFLNNLNMLMDIVFHCGACVLVFAPCGICFQNYDFHCIFNYLLCMFMDDLCVNDIRDALYNMDELDCG
ncbi:unnamed protein product [Cuscuta europaea]|uniref:Uncharacterized protein n=1 Tax=Cuscuta europaea TaxID=41803 RepID=A0A9P1ENK0_CUSEU|nr:unnamed protein product [Cuscuta europaea]